MNHLIFHNVIQSSPRQILCDKINQIISFINSIVFYQVRMVNFPECFYLVLQSFFSFEFDFLSLIGKNLCCSSNLCVFVFNQVDCCECSTSKSLKWLIKLVETFVRDASFEFLVNFLSFWNVFTSQETISKILMVVEINLLHKSFSLCFDEERNHFTLVS